MEFLADYFLIFYMLTISGTAICGLGLFAMGKHLEVKGLFALGFFSAFFMTPVWMLDIPNGSKVYLTTLLLAILLHSTKKFSWFVSTGAALSGLALMTILEFSLTFFLQFNPSWLIRVLQASPSALVGLSLGILGQNWLRINQRGNWFEGFANNDDVETERSFQIVPLGQLFNAFILVAVISSIVSWPIAARWLPLILTGCILWSFYFTGKYYKKMNPIIWPLNLIDLVIMVPTIFLILQETGGAESYWKVLLLVLVITNSLKNHRLFGISAVFFSGVSLLYFGNQQMISGSGWFWELDLTCFLILALIFWLIRFFIASERNLKEKAEVIKRNLLSSISHDLRTPMTLVQGYTEVLLYRDSWGEEERSPYLQLILEKTRELKRFARDLLELVKLEMGDISLNPEKLSARDFMENVRKAYELKARKQGLKLEVEIPDDFKFSADPYFLGRVIANLLFNAFTHTPSGGKVILGAYLRERSNEIIFCVKDTGRGIREDELSRIFLRFYRGSGETGKKGKGLGLPIAREIVGLHGGRIWVESKKNEGTTFFFTLPVAQKGLKPADLLRKKGKALLKPIPLAQFFSAFFVGAAFFASGLYLGSIGGSQSLNPIYLGVFVLGGTFPLLLNKKFGWLSQLRARHIWDLPVLFPLIHLVLANTGYSASPWKLLFIPLIITNSLKPQKYFGLISVILAAGSLLVIGFLGFSQGMDWVIEQDLVYMTIMVLVFIVTSHLKKAEETQKVELAYPGRGFLTKLAGYLQDPLEEIITIIEGVMEETKRDPKTIRSSFRNLQARVLRLKKLIEDIFELIQLEENRAIVNFSRVSLEEIIEDSGEKEENANFPGVEFSFFHEIQPCDLDVFPSLVIDRERFTRALASLISIFKGVAFPEKKEIVQCSVIKRGEEIIFCLKSPDGSQSHDEFEPFSRMEWMIADRIIKLHGGKFQINRTREGGFSLNLHLPI